MPVCIRTVHTSLVPVISCCADHLITGYWYRVFHRRQYRTGTVTLSAVPIAPFPVYFVATVLLRHVFTAGCGCTARAHPQLEHLSDADKANALIAYPILLEEWLMEGSYNKVRVLLCLLPNRVNQNLILSHPLVLSGSNQ